MGVDAGHVVAQITGNDRSFKAAIGRTIASLASTQTAAENASLSIDKLFTPRPDDLRNQLVDIRTIIREIHVGAGSAVTSVNSLSRAAGTASKKSANAARNAIRAINSAQVATSGMGLPAMPAGVAGAPVIAPNVAPATDALRKVRRQADKANKAVGRTLNPARGNLHHQLDEARAVMRAFGASALFSSDSVGRLFKLVAITFGVRQIVNATTASIRMATEFERTSIAFRTMIGDAKVAAKLVADSRQLANVTPFTSRQVLAAGRTLIGYGFEVKDVIPTTRMLGDVSSATGKDLRELSVIYGQIRSAGKLMGQDLLQLVQAGFNPLKEISRTTGRSMSDLKDDMRKGLVTFDMVQAAFQSATSKGGLFFGMMEEQSKTLPGRWSTLVDSFQQTGASIAQYLIEPMKEVVIQATKASNALRAVTVGEGTAGQRAAVETVVGVGGGLAALQVGKMVASLFAKIRMAINITFLKALERQVVRLVTRFPMVALLAAALAFAKQLNNAYNDFADESENLFKGIAMAIPRLVSAVASVVIPDGLADGLLGHFDWLLDFFKTTIKNVLNLPANLAAVITEVATGVGAAQQAQNAQGEAGMLAANARRRAAAQAAAAAPLPLAELFEGLRVTAGQGLDASIRQKINDGKLLSAVDIERAAEMLGVKTAKDLANVSRQAIQNFLASINEDFRKAMSGEDFKRESVAGVVRAARRRAFNRDEENAAFGKGFEPGFQSGGLINLAGMLSGIFAAVKVGAAMPGPDKDPQLAGAFARGSVEAHRSLTQLPTSPTAKNTEENTKLAAEFLRQMLTGGIKLQGVGLAP